eukprot:TRINITY_DN96787_c0_g1_i1.p1 TRINITY_DN96787_c0_g1~~TRINITY_DN96787_c0_g1_i1.p1  ORF type:complete len:371 (+),score=81.53 TRINITY_DN96787_c0_g1_i1:68-1180(+)
MLTISISESLSMGPEAQWQEWQHQQQQAEAEHMMTWLESDGVVQGGSYDESHEAVQSPWDQSALRQLADFEDIWKKQPGEQNKSPAWSPLSVPTSYLQDPASMTDESWQVPQKLAVEGSGVVPTSSWASPLRVPLPEPIIADPLALPPAPSLTADARVSPWARGTEEHSIPSLFLDAPPGLSGFEAANLPPKPASLSRGSSATETQELPLGMSISSVDVGGLTCTRVEWRIEDLFGKLQASMGRPLVSPPFAANGLPNLRLMVFPDGRDTMKNARSGERKGLYAAMIKKGPLNGALKLKADCLECATVMRVNLTVGGVRAGPLIYDFSEQAIHGLDDFGVDWLKQVDRASGSLTVGMEILEVRPRGSEER